MDQNFYKNSNNCITSLQTTGLDIVFGLNAFKNPKEVYYCDNFACLSAVIDDIESIIVVKTSMYPNDYNNLSEELKNNYIDFVLNVLNKGKKNDNLDIYYLGVGLRQTGVNIKEAGKFIVGRRYTGCADCLQLIRKSILFDYGYAKQKPLTIQNKDYFKHLEALSGTIDSFYEQEEGIYKLEVKKEGLTVLYTIYLDEKKEEEINTNVTLKGFQYI